MHVLRFFVAAFVLTLVACGGSGRPDDHPAGGDSATEPLPAPLGAAGGVTGMPDAPGPNEVQIPEPAEDPSGITGAFDEAGAPLPSADAGVDAALSRAPATVDPAIAQQAVALVRDYHAAINGGALGRAYGFWADGGGASGQTAQEFADSFAEVEGMSVEIGAPSHADATTAQVPVTLDVRRLDGSQRRLTGHYVLRRSAETAAAADASAWRIGSAALREAGP